MMKTCINFMPSSKKSYIYFFDKKQKKLCMLNHTKKVVFRVLSTYWCPLYTPLCTRDTSLVYWTLL